jgi:cell wall-associated NlpC family hydrolase
MTKDYAFCSVSIAPMRREKSDSSEMVSQLIFGETVDIIECDEPWVKLVSRLDHYTAYVDEKQLFFLSKEELNEWEQTAQFQRTLTSEIQTERGKQQLFIGSRIGNGKQFNIGKHSYSLSSEIELPRMSTENVWNCALRFLNAPYLWGGKSPFGVDCSGFIQLVFRTFDIILPRDAWQQAELGTEVSFDEINEGDVAFFNNAEGKITHVGIIDSSLEIIHASGWVRIDDLTQQGIVRRSDMKLSHKLCAIKRFKSPKD